MGTARTRCRARQPSSYAKAKTDYSRHALGRTTEEVELGSAASGNSSAENKGSSIVPVVVDFYNRDVEPLFCRLVPVK